MKFPLILCAIAIIHSIHASDVIEARRYTCADKEECASKTLNVDKLFCTGFRGCTSAVVSGKTLHAYGYESNINGKIEPGLKMIEGFGSHSLFFASGTLAEKNYFYSNFAFYEAEIDTIGVPNVYAHFAGAFSVGSSSTFTCSEGSECTFECETCSRATFIAESGSKITLKCKYSDSCDETKLYLNGNSFTVENDADSDLKIFVNTDPPSSDRRRLQVEVPEVGNKRNLRGEVSGNLIYQILRDRGSEIGNKRNLQNDLSCNDEKSCSDMEIPEGDHNNLYCVGADSCTNAQIFEPGFGVNCMGPNSCYNANIVGQLVRPILYCDGYKSCHNTEIRSNLMYSFGYQGLHNSVVKIDLKHEVSRSFGTYISGYEAAHNTIFIVEGLGVADYYEYYTLYCDGGKSCKNSVLDCSSVPANMCTLKCSQGRSYCADERQGVTFIDSCSISDGDEMACTKNAYCVYHEASCVSRRTYCDEEIKDDCKSKQPMCQWKGGKCFMKKSKWPKIYKQFDGLI